jgi:Putative amidoligase enzyme
MIPPSEPLAHHVSLFSLGERIVTNRSCLGGIEMTSPLFRAYRGSPWRDEVKTTWAFLRKHYLITTNEKCSTHVHVSYRKGFDLAALQKIAQCIIHFEPAVEAIVPQSRRANSYAKSNWLDNVNFWVEKKSPRQAIEEIGNARARQEVVELMTPGLDKWFAWNFRSILDLRTLEFRKAGASTTVQEALAWAEFAMTFVLSAMQTENTPAYLNTLPPNVDGLRRFLLKEKRPADAPMCNPEYLKPLWAGKTGKESLQPQPALAAWESQSQKQKAARWAEKTRQLMLSKIEQAPWMSEEPMWDIDLE